MTDAPTAPAPRPRSQARAIWDQFRTHKGALFGLIVLCLLVLFVVIGPLIWQPEKLRVAEALKVRNLGPSWRFPLGTDQLGRDMLYRMMQAGKVSLAVGFIAMMIAIFVGTTIGVLAGYFRRLDGPLMRLTDMFLALPLIPLLLVLVMLFRDRIAQVLGPETGAFVLIVFAIGITSWMQAARIVRGEVLALREREYVLAARSIGAAPRRIILRHILPNVISPVMVAATLGVAEAIITESVLSFLGLGFPPDFPTWGRLLYDGLQYMQLYPERVLWPGLAISLTVLAVNYIGDGLRDALDPRIRGR
ncbi:MAG: ABC transporter permease [Rhodobacter sp.]|nr:ABC transporter permease [Rhodobacter sp.]MCA3520184.1 ABC transporter permease [Rhodobacter sp.]MCA3522115.1 ABC transporter permease [Rhodobacter sp.]MCA3524689.1 ABC transporter permease [Rhodobacter sp.]MCA3527926.1 ABC transporter permease [Rhodobacter sp.]